MFLLTFKNRICDSWQLNCVRNISLDGSKCLPPCTGLILKSFYKSNTERNLEQLIPKYWDSYKKYKKFIEFPTSLKGLIIQLDNLILNIF